MPTVSYHSTTFKKAPTQEANGKTSSQIFLSRGVADSDIDSASSPCDGSPTAAAPIFESSSKYIFKFGDPPRPVSVERILYQAPTVEDVSYDMCDISIPKSRISRCFPSPDSRSSSSPCETSHYTTIPVANNYFTQEPGNTNFAQPPCPSKVIDKGDGKEVQRGRSREKGSRYPNPLARAESWRLPNSTAIELDARLISKRPNRSSAFFEDPSDPSAVLDDEMLEPCPVSISIHRSFPEVLDSPRSSRTKTALNPRPVKAKVSTREFITSLYECQTDSMAPILPPAKRYKSQVEAESWLFTADQRTGPHRPPSLAAGLPTEVIQQIFYSLHPMDFNAARHACRAWFVNSLERSLLDAMMRRGGWSSSIPRSLRSNDSSNKHSSLSDQYFMNNEWRTSKRLARECALSPKWTGNGLCNQSTESFINTSTIDFTDIAVHYPGLHSSGTIFTVSCCGKFLMAAHGCLIHIYELNYSDSALIEPGSLRPVTSIVCPQRVLACSMDTSSQRYAIAALLDGRMGLVCDISPYNICQSASLSVRSGFDKMSSFANNTTSFLDRISLNSSSTNLGLARSSSEPPLLFPGIAPILPPGTASAPDESFWQDLHRIGSPRGVSTEASNSQHSSLPRTHYVTPGSRTQSIMPPHSTTVGNAKSMPIECGPRSMYRNLCSDDDPPRSVAICPQRRCVAFGCSSGIELHWIDALTGQDLNRWFPLTAPSDYLYFLPPRKSVDSAKKLRLISSAALPGERAALSERAFGGRAKPSPFWERLGWGTDTTENAEATPPTQGLISRLRNEIRTRGLSSRTNESDHYRAIPLSDGYHILFTDPSTGLLCLGSDAPVGSPTKLLRKIWFQGPPDAGSPVAYAGGSHLAYGVRVVVAFGRGAEKRIWLFSVPSDIFAANSQNFQTMINGSWLNSSHGSQPKNLQWMNWLSDDGLQERLDHSRDPVPGVLPRSVWPVKINGQEIGKLSGLVDLAIDSCSKMTIWAFSSEGIAKVWQIDDGKFDGLVKQRLISRDGTIRERDGEGDLEMPDAPPCLSSAYPAVLAPSLPLNVKTPNADTKGKQYLSSFLADHASILSHRQESFDGTASLNISSSPIYSAAVDSNCDFHRTPCLVDYDAGADMLMGDLEDWEYEDISQGSFDDLTLAQAGSLVYETFNRSERLQFERSEDFVEGLTGVARIDIEIR